MIALLCFSLKSKSRLEAENAVLRRQLITAEGTRSRPPHERGSLVPSSLLKNPSPQRGFADSVFLSRIGAGLHAGGFSDQGRLFSYISPEARVPANHPLRKIPKLVRDVLGELNRSPSRLYACEGRPSIAPEQLLSALLLQVFYGIPSERQLMGAIGLQSSVPLVRGTFARRPGVGPDRVYEEPRPAAERRGVRQVHDQAVDHPQVKPLLWDEHFSVDGTLIEAWASQKSFRLKDGSGDDDGGANFHGQKRRTTRMRARPIPTADFTARRPGGRRSSATWGTPRWKTGMGWRWPAWSRSPPAPLSGALRRRLKAKVKKLDRRITVGEDKAMTLLTM